MIADFLIVIVTCTPIACKQMDTSLASREIAYIENVPDDSLGRMVPVGVSIFRALLGLAARQTVAQAVETKTIGVKLEVVEDGEGSIPTVAARGRGGRKTRAKSVAAEEEVAAVQTVRKGGRGGRGGARRTRAPTPTREDDEVDQTAAAKAGPETSAGAHSTDPKTDVVDVDMDELNVTTGE